MGKKIKTCTWKHEQTADHAYYVTACGQDFCFEDGTPVDNKFKFCPYCGKKIRSRKETQC